VNNDLQSNETEFKNECEDVFSFLLTKHQFSGPTIDAYPNQIVITYLKREVAIECLYDERDDDVTLKIVRLIDGKVPSAYRLTDDGVLVREYLTKLLIGKGIRDINFQEAVIARKNKRDRKEILRKELEGFARLLQLYGTSVLEGSAEIFRT
jgi:hypothetical protein